MFLRRSQITAAVTLSSLAILASLIAVASSPVLAQNAGVTSSSSGTIGLPAGVSPSAARAMLQSQGLDASAINALKAQVTGQTSGNAAAPPSPTNSTNSTGSTNSNNPNDAKSSDTMAMGESTDTAPKPGSFAYFVMQATGRSIPVFGQDLFKRNNTFAALESQPVPADYSIGPGDELILKIYGGAVDFDQRVTVDRSGMILLPKVGPVSVAGIRVRDLEPTLKRHISKYLSDFSLFASLGSLRGIEVYVVGQARAPGKYVVSSVSTLISALFATGGPGDNGSMRQIELVRSSKVVAKIDLYDFITKGDTSKDTRLLPGDVINIPPAGPKVALIGTAKKEGIFELAPAPLATNLQSLVALSGGMPVVTSPLQASVERIQPNQNRPLLAQTVELNDTGLNTILKDGDIVTLFPIKPAFENAITLKILDSPPIRIPVAAGARIHDVIPTSDTLLTSAFWQRRFAPTNTQDNFDTKLAAIRAMSKVDQINWEQAIIERVRTDDLRTEVISFSLREALKRKPDASNPVLLPGDVVTIFSQRSIAVPEHRQTRIVQIEGEIGAPGVYELKPGETLPELLARAGGPTANAYIYGTEVARESVREQQKKNLSLVIRRLESGLASMDNSGMLTASTSAEMAAATALREQNRQSLRSQIERLKSLNPNGRIALELDPRRQRLPQLTLEDGDVIRIPKAPGSVAAVGSVYSESVLIYRAGRTVNDYLQIAGVSESAEVDQTFVVRADGSVVAPDTTTGLLASLNPFGGRDVKSLELMPGDVIVVPEKFNKESTYSVFMRGLKDWTQVLYQMGLAAAAINTLNK